MQPLLEVDRVCAGYGRVQVLNELRLTVPQGSVVALLGPNGVGKTTALRVISGTLPATRGEVRFEGHVISGRSTHEIARRGITLVPEGRGVFPNLSVADNLDVAVRVPGRGGRERRARLDDVLDRFSVLAQRRQQRAGTLSGGEQQMLAVARAFLSDARLLLLDEISMGLAPIIVANLFETIATLRDEGMTILVVEQFLSHALRLADVCYVMAKGRVLVAGDPAEIRSHGHRYLSPAG
ncbi:MAG TPA: ABC transporter ATP-binding protein [Acidimicrobiales bacterium]